MKKKIGAKIIVIMLLLTIVFVINIVVSYFTVNNLSKASREVSDKYIVLESYGSTIARSTETCKMYSNMLITAMDKLIAAEEAAAAEAAANPDAAASTDASTTTGSTTTTVADSQSKTNANSLANSTATNVNELNLTKESMKKVCESIGDEELSAAFKKYYDALATLSNDSQGVADFYTSGDYDSASELASTIFAKAQIVDRFQTAYEKVLTANIDELGTKIHDNIQTQTLLTAIMSAQFFVIVFFSIVYLIRSVVSPAKRANKSLKLITDDINNNNGDLTQRISVKTKDEVGQLVHGINGFIDQLQTVMKKIQTQTTSMSNSADHITSGINVSNENANSVLAAMEELSATMEEVAATVDQISSHSQEVLEASQTMRENADEGANLATDIKNRASSISEKTSTNMELTTKMVENKKVILTKSIEDSKNVEKIGELVEQILNITNQTNLLALNASIEAARAGEAGRGFAVVAEQIRILADESRSAANNIQTISVAVMDSVNTLAQNADDMLQYVSTDILSSLKEFVDMAIHYSNDADTVNSLMDDFNESAKNLEGTMSEISRGIDGINTAVDESAHGVADAADNTSRLVDSLNLIKDEADKNKEVSDLLAGEVHRFKQI